MIHSESQLKMYVCTAGIELIMGLSMANPQCWSKTYPMSGYIYSKEYLAMRSSLLLGAWVAALKSRGRNVPCTLVNISTIYPVISNSPEGSYRNSWRTQGMCKWIRLLDKVVCRPVSGIPEKQLRFINLKIERGYLVKRARRRVGSRDGLFDG